LSSVENENPTRRKEDADLKAGQDAVTPLNNLTQNSLFGLSQLEYGQAADSGSMPPVTKKPKNTAKNFVKAQTHSAKSAAMNDSKRVARNRARFSYALRLLLDTFLIILAFALAYIIRYWLQIGKEVLEENQVAFSEYLPTVSAFTFILVVSLHFKGFYRQSRVTTLLDEIGLIFSSTLVAVATMIVLVFISRPQAFSRLMFIYLIPLAITLLISERVAARTIRRALWKRGVGVRNLLVVGATDTASRLMQAVVERPNLGYNLKGYADSQLRFSEWTLPPRYQNSQPVPKLGSLQNLNELIYQHDIHELAIALPATHYEAINEIMVQCRESGVDFTLVPDIFELRVDSLNFTEINGVPLIGLKMSNLRGWNYLLKRAMDILMALVAIIATAPLMLVVAIAVKLDSRGPIIFRQTRVGKNGQPFTFYKFRSMQVDADAQIKELLLLNETGGATFKITNDPRRTRVGKFIRRTSLDELPQFFNILFGHMSFVGPRPPIDREVEKYQEWHYRRLEVTPGLTGLWQVSGRSKLTFEDMVKLDIYYAENWSLWLDIKILLRTIPAVIRGEGAY